MIRMDIWKLDSSSDFLILINVSMLIVILIFFFLSELEVEHIYLRS